MTREEFESILEEAFLEGYNDAMEEIFEEDSSFDLEEEMDSYNESNAATKAKNRETAKRVLEKHYQKAWDKEGNDERYVMNRQLPNGKYPNNPHIVPFKNGKIKDVQSMRYWRTSRTDDPYRDDTNRYMKLNENIKKRKMNKDDIEDYKDEIKSAARRIKNRNNYGDGALYNKKRLPK